MVDEKFMFRHMTELLLVRIFDNTLFSMSFLVVPCFITSNKLPILTKYVFLCLLVLIIKEEENNFNSHEDSVSRENLFAIFLYNLKCLYLLSDSMI